VKTPASKTPATPAPRQLAVQPQPAAFMIDSGSVTYRITPTRNGSVLTVRVPVRNAGGTAADARITCVLHADNRQVAGRPQAGLLRPGQAATVEFEFSLPQARQYRIEAIASGTNARGQRVLVDVAVPQRRVR
jgi:hypothetical protein